MVPHIVLFITETYECSQGIYLDGPRLRAVFTIYVERSKEMWLDCQGGTPCAALTV